MPRLPRPIALLALLALITAGVVLALLSATGSAPWSGGEGTSGEEAATEPCDDARPITHGPRVGAVTQDSAKIWVRSCRQTEIAVQYKLPAEDWSSAQESGAVTTAPTADNTAVVLLTGLLPGTEYDYRVLAPGAPSADTPEGRFKTMPQAGARGVASFILGADIHPSGRPLTIFDQLAQEPADFALLVGDLIDVQPFDPTNPAEATAQVSATPPAFTGKHQYEQLYRDVWADDHFRRFLATRPTFMVWDDHEILNDWDQGTAPPYPWARAAYEEYIGSANPEPAAPGELYYTIQAGDAELFVLDTRTHRSPRGAPETMLGLKQKADLKAWLLGSRAKFKFIVSSVMWSDYADHRQEAWVQYVAERDEILDFIRDQGVSGVVLLSGDEHWSAVFHLSRWGIYEITASPLGGFLSRATLRSEPEILFKLGLTQMYGRFRVDTSRCPATLSFQAVEADGSVRYELALAEPDLSSGGGAASVGEEYCRALQQGRLDSDGDGCTDGEERGADETRGGRRDPQSRWDFYDVNRDRRVDSADALAVANKLGAVYGDSRYDPVFDRSVPPPGADPWDLSPPDGAVDLDDFFLVLGQVGHSCLEEQ